MPDDAHDDMLRRHDEWLRSFAAILVRQDEINQELRAFNRQQGEINDRLVSAIERLEVTQARIETLLARMIRGAENGRDA